jgi:hypothetical protein
MGHLLHVDPICVIHIMWMDILSTRVLDSVICTAAQTLIREGFLTMSKEETPKIHKRKFLDYSTI